MLERVSFDCDLAVFDMISSKPLKYARTMAEVAVELGQLDRAGEELRGFSGLLLSHSELRETLSNPAVPFRAKRRIVEQIGQSAGLLPIVVNFLLVLMESAQMEQFDEVVEAYQRAVDDLSGVVQADVYSATELDEALVGKLEEVIGKITGSRAKVRHHLDEMLIGGLKVRIGSTIYDGSVGAQLEAIRRQLN